MNRPKCQKSKQRHEVNAKLKELNTEPEECHDKQSRFKVSITTADRSGAVRKIGAKPVKSSRVRWGNTGLLL